MLIGNYSVLAKDPGRSIGGGAIGLGCNRGNWNKTSASRGPFNAPDWEPKSGVPDGYRHPYAWVMPQTAGGLSARNALVGDGAFVGAIAGGVNGEATLAGVGNLNGAAALVVSLAAALVGSGTISSAAAVAYLNLAATLAASGDLAGAASALGHAAAALSGSGTGAATATATGTLAAAIVVTGDVLNSANVAPAVWNALSASYNVAGSMGEKLNDAGSAANPWTEVIESGYTAAQILQIVAAFVAGKTTIDASGSPVVVAFRNLADTKDRITGDMVDSERTAVTLDVD